MTASKRPKHSSRTNWKKIERMSTGKEPIDTSDIPEADEEFWAKAEFGNFMQKTPISVRFDKDLIEWFKRQGPRYQTRMNQVLRAYMQWHLSKQNSSRKSKYAQS